jgi:DNA-binding MarR family transcriptional regulator
MRKDSVARKPRPAARSVPLTVNRPELLVDGSDDEFRALVHDALAFSARLEAIRAGYGQIVGVTGPQYSILISVAHLSSRGNVSVVTVADHLHLSGSFVTTETNKLMKMGLLRKVVDPQDRRRVILRLTTKGQERFRELAKIQSIVNDQHFASLSRKDFFELRRIMAGLVESTDKALTLLRHLREKDRR